MSRVAATSSVVQDAFHDAFQDELRTIVNELPIPSGSRVFDLPCGNGFYSAFLAKRLGREDRLVAVDSSEPLLKATREALTVQECGVEVRKADAYSLPFEDESFDVVWCAQSLISLDPQRAIGEMFRVVKRGGRLAILEVDQFHHVLLPWPAELEVALPAAMLAASVERYGDAIKIAPARKLRCQLSHAGFKSVEREIYSFIRSAPFDERTATFLKRYFAELNSFAGPFLSAPMRELFHRAANPDSPDSLLRNPHAELLCINSVYLALRS